MLPKNLYNYSIIIFSCFLLLGSTFVLNKNNTRTNIALSFNNKITPSTYLVAGGDIMLSRYIGYLNKNQGYDRIFTGENYHPLSSFSTCDRGECTLLFNLESLFTTPDNDIPKGGFLFQSNPQNVETLNQLKKNNSLVLSLANNHIINVGYKGVKMTQEILQENSIAHIGAGLSPEESEQMRSEEKNGIKLCFQSYSYDGQYVKVGEGKISRNALNAIKIKEQLQIMDEENCDAKILSLHRGAEYRLHPNRGQKNLAHELIDAGTDLIIGGHSHVPGEIEQYKGKYIIYSLGNFLFDQSRGKRTNSGPYDTIYDHSLQKRTVPTYIALLAGFKIEKRPFGINIYLDQLEMTQTNDGIFSSIDNQTYQEMLNNIQQ
ncbi:MAG: CapA family protein [Candidatus Absconditabacteria bacterium]|nr:CapA family protein [Candidatus Absconditabacteria bacterium]MDD3868620.1 CapA family protein [Candidatus Absconditabacteria bacterium]MDD4714140.1 CapA family protein [Candidatus Absconditabacteria bacterium]